MSRLRISVERALQVLALVLLVALGAYLLTYTQDQRQAGECQDRVNSEFRSALSARTAASAGERAAVRQVVVEALADPEGDVDRERLAVALQRYLDAIDAADVERARVPLPTGDPGCS